MKIAFITTEAVPFAKTGGLADVAMMVENLDQSVTKVIVNE